MHTYVHTYIHYNTLRCVALHYNTLQYNTIQYSVLRMGIHPQYNLYPQVHSRIISSQGARIMMLLWLKTPTAGTQQNMSYAEARSRLTIGNIN